MTYYAGSWEYSSVNGMQVAMDVTWSAVTHTSTSVTATVKFYTDNQYSYSDNQTLNFSSNLGADYSFNNNDGTSEVYRTTKTYTYTYSSSSYGSSPGNVTFSGTISGAYDGVTPTVSASVAIPARPAAVPDAPVLTATTGSSSQINLSWTTPDNNGSALDAYVLQVSPTSSTTGFVNLFSDSTVPLSTTYSNFGLVKYKTYWYRVLASNGVGNSAYSAVKSATTLGTVPDVPTSFTATPDVTTVALSWVAPTDTGGPALTGYTVKRDGTTVYTGTSTSFTDTGLTPATAYSYEVTANNAIGSSSPATTSTTTIGGVVGIATDTAGTYSKVLPKVWNGTIWADANARIWDGTEWKYGI